MEVKKIVMSMDVKKNVSQSRRKRGKTHKIAIAAVASAPWPMTANAICELASPTTQAHRFVGTLVTVTVTSWTVTVG